MSIVLSVYSKNAFKEFVLPAVNNTEVTLLLEHYIFQIRSDIQLKLEVLDGEWYFQDMEERIYANSKGYGGNSLADQDTYTLVSKNKEELAIMVSVVESSFTVYDKFSLKGINRVSVGAAAENAITYSAFYGGAQIISGRHAELSRQQEHWVLNDQSANGVFVNDVRVHGSRVLEFGDKITIWGLRMVYLGDMLAIHQSPNLKIDSSVLRRFDFSIVDRSSENKDTVSNEKQYYHRSPRNMESLETETIEIEPPPAPAEEEEMPLIMLIGPSLTMMLPMMLGTGMAIISSQMGGASSGAYMYTGLITALFSGIFGAYWAVSNMNYAKKKTRQNETRRFDAYSEYLMKCSEEVKEKYTQSIRILRERYPSVDHVMGNGDRVSDELWGRNRSHEDFLYHRLGVGSRPFQIGIEVPKEKFQLINDSLADKPKFIKESYKIMHDVPVGIDLEENTLIGVVGGERKAGAYQVVYNLVAQLATQNCYTDVKMAFILRDEKYNGQDAWSFTEWLPHVWSQNKKSRYVSLEASQAGDVCYDLTQVLRQRAEETSAPGGEHVKFNPHYVLFVEDESLLEGEMINKYIYGKEKKLGITTVLMAEKYSDLPNACECIIQNDSEYQGIFNVKSGRNNGTPVKFDSMNAKALRKIARMLANLEVNEVEVGGEIPGAVTFFEMYGVTTLEELNVLERWKKNRTYDNMKSLIGIKSGGQYCYLDLHERYHGPHGLVAGTTGSGKSETLQTYMLSLALNFSPDDIGFFIIDYKGGGMGNLFSGLPHILGQISNLSGNQVQRAMVSIKSENVRRQRIFNENGVNNINAYTRLYKNGEAKEPVPHLFIIIDEFAELKREEPDFMRGLISVAQVGRSLGVHLILATQKPSGTVDDNIWSNSKFRLCLRVQDRQDSMDMLHKPDAAYLTQAGRGYLQVGNDELYEQFQSGWSGAVYDDETGSAKQVIAKLLTSTGRAGLVGNHMKSKRKAAAKLKWITSLYEIVSQADVEDISGYYELLAKAGIDYPNNEYNSRLLHNFVDLYYEACNACGNEKTRDKICGYIIEVSENRKIKLPEMKEKSQLDAVVEYLAQLTKTAGYQKQQPLWLPVLPKTIPLNSLDGYEGQIYADGQWPAQEARWELKVMVGLCDDPVNQFQMPMVLNFAQDGNHAVCGISMSGKSTFLQTVVYSLIQSYSPEYLNLYILDFSSRMMEPFENDAHVGGILYENDLDTVGKFFHMLQSMVQERKELFRGGNYYQYVSKNGMVCPAVVVVIDNIANFREKTEELYDDLLLQISRECTANGIYLLISGAGFNTTEISSKLSENIRRAISLEMQDKFAYSDILRTMQITTLPEPGVAGRGLVETDGSVLEFQTCVALEASDDYNRVEQIQSRCKAMTASWKGKHAKPIPYIPEKPVWPDFRRLEEVQKQIDDMALLPMGYNLATAAVTGINLKQTYCYMISGKKGTGKTNLLRILMRAAAEKRGKVVVVEFNGVELSGEAQALGVRYIGNEDEYFTFVEELIPVFQKRNALRLSYKSQALEDDEIFTLMNEQYEPYFIFIADLVDYTEILHRNENNYCIDGAITNFQEKGSMLNIYFFAALNPDKTGNAVGETVYETFTYYKTGVHLGGFADSLTIMEFPGLGYKELSSGDKPGCGLLSADDSGQTVRIVTPFARGEA